MNKTIPFKHDISFENKIAEIRSISLEHNYKLESNVISGNFIISGNYKLTDASVNLDMFEFDVPFDISIDKKYDTKNVTVDINDFFYELVNNQILAVNIELLIEGLMEREEREVKEVDVLEEKSDEEIESLESAVEEKEDAMKSETEIIKSLENTKEVFSESNDAVGESTSDLVSSFKEAPTQEVFKETMQKDSFKEVALENTDTQEIKQVSADNINVKSIFDNMDESEGYVVYKVHVVTENDNIQTICEKYSIDKDKLELYNNLDDLKIGAKIIIPNE